MTRPTLPIALLGLCWACGGDLPRPGRIAYVRPLAMRTTVVGDAADPEAAPRAEALPLETVEIEPFVATPTGPLTDLAARAPVWIACDLGPGQLLGTCLTERLPDQLGDLPPCAVPDPAGFDPEAELPEVVTPCVMGEGTPDRPRLTLPLDPLFLLGGDVEVTLIAGDRATLSTEACAEAFFARERALPEDCLFALQRVSVGPDARLVELARELGFPGVDAVPVPETIPDPDAHPRIVSFEVQRVDARGHAEPPLSIDRGAIVELGYGETAEIVAATPAEDMQSYVIPRDRESYVDKQERPEGDWYRTWGDLFGGTSDLEALNTWELRADGDDEPSPPGDQAFVYYVIRDGRIGVDWWWFEARLVGTPER